MKKQLLILVAALAVIALLTPCAASAQMPNMDMSWAIRSQMQFQRQGDLNARRVAMMYYNYMLRLRKMGYTGPSLPTGVTPQSLAAANARLQQSYDAYNQSAQHNSDVTHNAVNNWDYQAIRGCWWSTKTNGERVMVCP
jgi:hypothetical protein